MKKTISKLISLFSLGLLLLAVPDSYAFAQSEKTPDQIKMISGDEFININVVSKKLDEDNCYAAKESSIGDRQKTTRYCIEEEKGQKIVKAATGDFKGCEVIEVSWYNSKECTYCPLIGILYKASETISGISKKNLANSFAVVIALGLLIWIAYKTLVFVSELSKQDAAKYITEILEQSFKFLIAFFALLIYDDVFEYIINPILRSGMSFGTSFVSVEGLKERFGEDVFNALISDNQSSLAAISGKLPQDYVKNSENTFFTLYTYSMLENLAYNVNLQYSLLQTVGRSLMCVGVQTILHNIVATEPFGLGLACLVYGFCFASFGFVLVLSFVFYLFDAVVQLGIVGALLPALIASWPFKITSKYTKKGFEMLLNSTFIFMTMGLITKVNIELIKAAIDFNISRKEADEGVPEGLSAIVNALSLLDTTALNSLVNVISIGFIMFLVVNVIAMMMIKKVKDFANKFSSGCLPDIGAKAGGIVASASVGAAKKLAAPGALRTGMKEGFKDGTSGVRRFVKGKAKKFKNKIGDKLLGSTEFGKRLLAIRYQRKENEGKPDAAVLAQNQQSIDDIFTK